MGRGSSFLLAMLLGAMPVAKADDVTVGCTGAGAGPFDFTSISDALTALHAISFRDHTVTISGTCSEYVQINDFENLTLQSTDGAVILDPGTTLFPVLHILRSENVELAGLTIRGVEQPIDLVRIFGSEVSLRDCVVEKGGVQGMFISSLARVAAVRTTVQDHTGQGIRVDANSLLQLGLVASDPEPVVIQNNGGAGLFVNTGAALDLFGSTTVQDNAGPGLLLFDATVRSCCDPELRRLLRNGTGISAQRSSVDFIGSAQISDNVGIGVLLNSHSAARFRPGGQTTIRGNGLQGVFALRNSEVSLGGSEITENGAGGLVLRENASATVFQSSISENGAEGIHLSYLSTLSLFSSAMVSGNTGFDFYCTPDSRALGSKAGVSRMSCPGFSVAPDPTPGGPPTD